jgi:hypothetical protein
MNKGLRNEIKHLKFKNRLKKFGLKMMSSTDWKCYRTTSTPCSCDICSPGNRIETGLKKKKANELKLAFI